MAAQKKTIATRKIKAKSNIKGNQNGIKWLEDYTDMFSFNKKMMTQTGLEKFCADLMKWVISDDDALRLDQFYAPKGISKDTFEGWCKRYDIASQTKKAALNILGSRRDIGALTRKYDAGHAARMMGYYDSDWVAEERRKIDDKVRVEEAKSSDGPKFVVIKDFESSDLVPEKKDKTVKTPEEIAGTINKSMKKVVKEYSRKIE